MKYAFLVAWREYSENAKTKGFWIGLFLFPLILLLSIEVPVLLEKKATPVRHFVLVDPANDFAPVVQQAIERSYQRHVLGALKEYARKNAAGHSALEDFNESSSESLDTFLRQGGADKALEKLRPSLRPGVAAFTAPRHPFQQVALPAEISPQADFAIITEALKPYLRGEKRVPFQGGEVELTAAILIPRDLASCIIRPERPATATHSPGPDGIQYWSANPDTVLREEVERAVNTEVRRREYLARGLDAGIIRQVEHTYTPVANLNPKKEKGREAMGTADVIRQWAPSAFVYLLWVAIFSIMQMLLTNTVEEKSNRIVEVLLSSVTPGELMMGKLCGIAATGLTMIGAWMVALFAILSWKSGGASEIAGQIFTVLRSSNLVPVFAIYFLLGYLLYASFILSIGSVCNTLKEAQSYMAMITMILMVPLMTMTFIPKDPNGSVARILSWIPLYTPFTMMNRATADPPVVDLVGTLVLLVATTVAALFMAGKIFRIGILRTGQPPKILEMLRWALRR